MSDKNIIGDVNYGPLACLVGTWTGDKGMDRSPEPDGVEENPYFETILFEAIGDVTNSESQKLAVLRYHQVVSRKSTKKVFHNETGYWMWDSQVGIVMHSLTIPRAVCVLAGGKFDASQAGASKIILAVKASLEDKDWGIIQSPFMREKARTVSFQHQITVEGNELSYSETTCLQIYGKPFDHTDTNTLHKFRDAAPH
jgi:methylamine---glutamate N-methyltransferase subunit C